MHYRLQVAQLFPWVHILKSCQPLLLCFAEERVSCACHRTHLRIEWDRGVLVSFSLQRCACLSKF
jgi:hypothetical protein